MHRASFYTLGCRLNQTETALVAGALRRKGYAVVPWGEPADLVVVNTCSVTEHAEARCRNVVRQALRRSPEAFVVVTGCYAQVGLEALRAIEGVDLIVGTEYKDKFLAYIDRPRKLDEPVVLHSKLIDDAEFEIDGVGEYATTRANLKIQDGCDFFCSFCIIPFTRGRERSRRAEDVLREARALARRGHREIVLTGVNIGRYRDESGLSLAGLVAALEGVEGLERIRITSIEPTTIEPALVDRMAVSAKLCPYLHVPLQSGDDAILARMNRRYRAEELRRFVEEVAARIPDVGLGTDVIVGFPGETDASFARTYALLEELPLAYFHVFSYSRRYGTKAARMDGHVPPERIKERSLALRRLSERKRRAFAARFLGRTVDVLFEQRDEAGRWTGLTGSYLRVGVAADEELANRILPVRIEGYEDGLALGALEPEGAVAAAGPAPSRRGA